MRVKFSLVYLTSEWNLSSGLKFQNCSFGPQYRCLLMNLEPVGYPEVSYEQSTKAFALLFGGRTRSDSTHPVRQQLGFPGMFSKASLTARRPISQGVRGNQWQHSTATPHGPFGVEKAHLTDIPSDWGQHRSLKSTPLDSYCVSPMLSGSSCQSDWDEASKLMFPAVLRGVAGRSQGPLIPNTPKLVFSRIWLGIFFSLFDHFSISYVSHLAL